MNVQVNGQRLFIGWHYDNRNCPKVTECIVKNTDREVVAKSLTRRRPTEVCNKDTARKFSLTLALQNLSLDKESRRVIWQAYLNRKQPQQLV